MTGPQHQYPGSGADRDPRGREYDRPAPGGPGYDRPRYDSGYEERRPGPGYTDGRYDEPRYDEPRYDERRPGPGYDEPRYDERRYDERRPGPGYDDGRYDERRPAPGFDAGRPPERGPRPPREPSRLWLFVRRDQVFFLLGLALVVCGLLLLVSPWFPLFDLVSPDGDGKLMISGSGSLEASRQAMETFKDDDTREALDFLNALTGLVMGPVAWLWRLAGLLTVLGGLFVLATSRRLGAMVVIAANTLLVVIVGMVIVFSVPDVKGHSILDTAFGYWVLMVSGISAIGVSIAVLVRTRVTG